MAALMVRPGTVRLGAGAGFAGDRLDPALDLARRGDLDYLVFECLGERTVAAAHARRRHDPRGGWDPLLGTRMRAVLPTCRERGTTVVTNSGAADPAGAAAYVREVAAGLGLHGLRVAAVTGDDVLDAVLAADPVLWETGEPLSAHPATPLSANAYLGAAPVVQALAAGTDVVLTGRLADPALYLGPLAFEHGWALDGADADYGLLGAGTAVGHLLECAGQLTGGYYADPVTKPVKGLDTLGFPYADVAADGTAVLGKLDGTGGELSERTAAEQLLYEVDDPNGYVTPDVVADFSGVRLTGTGPDRVRVDGATGRARPDQLKVTVGFAGGWLGEGEISYAGPRALDRARLAAEVVVARLRDVHGVPEDLVTVELIGAGAAFRGLTPPPADPVEVRLRVAARVADADSAAAVGWEVEALYTNGPAGGGGARTGRREVVAIRSCLLDRDAVRPHVEVVEVP